MAPSFSPKATPPKAGTSRLLSMKFMSRLGPADTSPTFSSPLASEPSTPASRKRASADASDDEDGDSGAAGNRNGRPSEKRRKMSMVTATTAANSTSGPSPADQMTMADMEATMRASMEDEERRRQAAIKKRAAELGDEHWTWDAPLPPYVASKLAANTTAAGSSRMPFSVVRVGFAEIDSRGVAAHGSDRYYSSSGGGGGGGSVGGNGDEASLVGSTKPVIMRFNMKKSTQLSGEERDASDNSDEAMQDDGQRSEPGKARKRARSDAEPQRKKAATKLKHLTSLSSQGGQSTMKCHRCGRPGHKAVECPTEQKRPGSWKR
ncbi:Zinc finger, CCHC-type [Niveomyces insectorum RCEF 264]|uniref:Zinc finger, CCHC-type n=1 Tax=Niveomyces insectorum RCEF 264 TaxID=1081102 RepID=A0A167R9T2_9HYPO|nr:Zinc finger, CCHC-type [Niveomyces insectorum RCEF 264]